MRNFIHFENKSISDAVERKSRIKALLLVAAVLVVVCVTYALVLPAFTLEKDEAEKQGGIDIKAEEQIEKSEDASEIAVSDTESTEAGSEHKDAETETEVKETASKKSDKETDSEKQSGKPSEKNSSEQSKAAAQDAEKSEDDENKDEAISGELGLTTAEYKASIKYDKEAGIPEDAELSIEQIESGRKYTELYEETAEAVRSRFGADSLMGSVLLYDISIVSENREIEPKSSVKVSIDYNNAVDLADGKGRQKVRIIHFRENADGTIEPEFIDDRNVDAEMEKSRLNAVSFEADSFSAYAIVQGPEPVPAGWSVLSSISEIAALGEQGVYMSHANYYITNQLVHGVTDNADRDGIQGTTESYTSPETATGSSDVVQYYFEKDPNNNNSFYIYTLIDGVKNYAKMTKVSGNNSRGGLTFVQDKSDASSFLAEKNGSNSEFIFSAVAGGTRYYWNRNSKNPGSGTFVGYNNKGDVNTAKFSLWKYEHNESDPYGLDGTSYGLMSWSNGVTGKAMMAESSQPGALDAMALTVMAEKDNNEDKLFVSSDSDITMWTFEWIEDDRYYLTTIIDGNKKYIRIGSNGVSLSGTPEDDCQLHVVCGSGAHKGEICLKSGDSTLTFSGKTATGFNTSGQPGSEWLHLVSLSELTPDYFMTHTAKKVSVSDESVTNGSRIIVYTRVWNDDTKKYEFYAVNSDGSLVRCYDGGDDIRWSGSLLNTMLWNFVEYYYEGTSEPNYYYDLYNQYAEKYITPQSVGEDILSDDPIGVNMRGRRDGAYESEIVAWNDDDYTYTGLKADVETGKVVACPKSQADDFYFAIMQDIPVDDELDAVTTVDHTKYGITMKIQNFGTKSGGWNEQDRFLGNNEGGMGTVLHQGLLQSELGSDGYPMNQSGTSMATLYNNAKEVNHLFIKSTYSGTGYFEYDSAQNFASLKNNDFVVYRELGTMDNSNKDTLKHGQFMPYNDIEAGTFASVNGKNLYNAEAEPLPDSDPRKNEQLYLVKNPDYYFGVELEASFTQTPNGLDDWGHDIIYEFTGDDDFWLYVDNELVIDLGGIHSAVAGNVNFSTGEVYVNGNTTTLREVFADNYRARNEGATDAEVEAYLSHYFNEGETIFTDYSTHTMRIFYMERGAGASNLHMRFNLASVKPGTVLLSKEVSGVDEEETILAEYPYQVYYRTEDGVEHRLSDSWLDDENFRHVTAFYKDTNTKAAYMESLTIGGIEYENVFMLKPKETIEINLPDGTVDYRIVECGINTDVYNKVSVNEAEIEGTSGAGYEANRKDYSLDFDTSKDRPRVVYDNEVDPDALCDLTITKELFEEDGVTPIAAGSNDTPFSFRLYLGTEFESSPELANMHTYHVKDDQGNYCIWDKAQKKFVALEGKTRFSDLTEEEKTKASFTTSMNGSISKIPAGYTVEVRNVLAGSSYRVVERPNEIPDGYSFQKYVFFEDDEAEGQPISGDDPDATASQGVSGNIVSGKDPHVDVCNLRGHGLRVNKVWTDKDYMIERDPVYFAVYTHDDAEFEDSELTLVEGSVRQMAYGEESLYWYWLHLPVRIDAGDHYETLPFDRYEIREVIVTNPAFDQDDSSVVTSYDSIEILSDEDEFTLQGQQRGETSRQDFTYTVLYERGTQEQESNVRVDKVTNNRPGIVLRKTDWDGDPLKGATFTLKEKDGAAIGSYTSDEKGDITVAFLSNNRDYELIETEAPEGYRGLESPAVIRLENDSISVSGIDSDMYILEQEQGVPHTLTIKNRPYTFEAVKIDGSTEVPLAGVKFALHKQHTVGDVTSIDPVPMDGYDSLVSDEDGIIPKIDGTLGAGTYELRELEAKQGYEKLPSHIRFTLNEAGILTLGSHPDGVDLIGTAKEDGTYEYVLSVKNYQRKKVSFKKVDIADVEHSALEGAKFDLYETKIVDDEVVRKEPALYTGLESGSNGILKDNTGKSVFDLPVGTYHLVETEAPAGYMCKTYAVVIYVTETGITYEEGTDISSDESGMSYDEISKVYTLKISNKSGYELPSAGGAGTHWIYIIGALLVIGSLIALITKFRVSAE